MIKVLHTGDIHLDCPFTLLDATKSRARKADLRNSFSAMCQYAKDNSVDFVLIAGDLFESEYVTKESCEFVCREFEKCPDVRFIITPGNHDPYTENSVYRKSTFPDNVYIFTSPTVECMHFDDLNTDIYGYAFTSPYMESNPFKGTFPQSKNKINILCGHGDTSTALSKYCPITDSDIRDSGFDYIALAHIHVGKEPTKVGDTWYAYPGCIEGRDYSESGYKGALVGTFTKDENGFRHSLNPVRFSRMRYGDEKLNATGFENSDQLIKAINDLIIKCGYGEDSQVRITIEGNVSPSLDIIKPLIEKNVRPLFGLELVDKTSPLYDVQKLKSDPTIKGAFFNAMLPLLESENPAEREIAVKALHYGLGALDGNDIVDFEV